MSTIKQPLTNVQLELLKVFSHNLNEKELLELKDVLANFFADRLINLANQVWEENAWTEGDVQRMLHTNDEKI